MKIIQKICVVFYLTIIPQIFAQTEIKTLFSETDKFLNNYVLDGYVNYEGISNNRKHLMELVELYQNVDLEKMKSITILKAFWINAYNVNTIKSVVNNYPLSSPLKVKGFFNSIKHKVAGENFTLDEIEKVNLLQIDKDPKIHFAINCAAIGCPKLIRNAYYPETLKTQLLERAKSVVNDDYYVRVDKIKKTVYLNEIFKWYKNDFLMESENIIDFLNSYRLDKIPNDFLLEYIKYDWKLNSTNIDHGDEKKKNEIFLQEFTPAALLYPGQYEIKLFNNLYTQTSFFNQDSEEQNQNSRSTFNTLLTSFLYGISNSINIGFDLWIRSVKNDDKNESPLNVFDLKNTSTSRTAISSFGPKIKFDPFSDGFLDGFSVQSSFLIPLASNLEGGDNQPFLDFDSFLWLNQFYYDKSLSNELSFFGEVDTWFRIDRNLEGKSNSIQIPVKGFLSYYLTDNITFYGMTEFSYKFGEGDNTSFYSQAGLGAKYQIFNGIELEGLFTKFYLGNNSGAGNTYNLGIRIVQ